MYSLAVSDHFMIAHSFRGEVFGPAQKVHGATYGVEIEFRRPQLDDNALVCDIGLALTLLRDVLAEFNYQNLDALPQFKGVLTTTEYLCKYVFDALTQAARDGALGRDGQSLERIRVTLSETDLARATYEGAVRA